ncbi:MAG: universal stress protein [Flavobacteriales bacterium]|nr:universal stress protein [Flavobacteriales bacterium]
MMKILCPTDLTLATDIALSHAGNIAQRGNGEVTLFHVLTKEEVKNNDIGNPGPHVKTLDLLSKQGVKVNRVDREGSPLKEIVAEAKNGHALMVAGTHGVQGLRQEWLGSDMLKRVREVPIPTLVVQMYSPRTENIGHILMPVVTMPISLRYWTPYACWPRSPGPKLTCTSSCRKAAPPAIRSWRTR